MNVLGKVALFLALGATIAPASVDLPDLGDASATVISAAEERRLGKAFMRQARDRLSFIDDPELIDYVSSLGARLVEQAGGSPGDFHFYIVKDPNLNAFAVPGGFIGIHTGLALAAETESQLASVLAHEITHLTQRHMPRLLAAARQRSVPAMAALIAAALLGGDAGRAAVALTSAAAAAEQLKYTRAFEREADRLGMRALAGAGFDPRAMPAFFERLQNWGRLYDTHLPEFLRTHPVTAERIAESRARAERYPPLRQRDERVFRHFQAKIRVVGAADPQAPVRYFEAKLQADGQGTDDAARYGYALALSAAGRHPAAREAIGRLLQRHPDSVRYQLAAGAIETGAGRLAAALVHLRRAHTRAPRNRAVVHAYGAALIAAGRPREARQVLDRAVRYRRDDAALFRLLAQAAGESGDRVGAHRALAEYHYLNDRLQAALDQLKLAARYAGDDFYLQAGIQARRREIQEELVRLRQH